MNRFATACTLVGALFGASAMFVYEGRQIDNLLIENQALKQENQDFQNENELLSTKLQHYSPKRMIRSINVEVKSGAQDGLAQLAIVQKVKQELGILIDSDMSQLNPKLPAELVDDTIVKVDKLTYVIHPLTVVIAEKLYIAVSVKLIESGS